MRFGLIRLAFKIKSEQTNAVWIGLVDAVFLDSNFFVSNVKIKLKS